MRIRVAPLLSGELHVRRSVLRCRSRVTVGKAFPTVTRSKRRLLDLRLIGTYCNSNKRGAWEYPQKNAIVLPINLDVIDHRSAAPRSFLDRRTLAAHKDRHNNFLFAA